MRFLIVLALVLTAVGCTRSDHSRKVLDDNGYTDIQMTGFAVWMCGRDDNFADGFTAKAPNGRTVEGAVCSAWGKGATIRFR